jgi:hypothetical protein
MVAGGGQRDDLPGPGTGWQPEPGDVAAQVLEPDLPPVEAAPLQVGEEVTQVLRVGTHSVRRPLHRRQMGQERLDRLHDTVLAVEHGP